MIPRKLRFYWYEGTDPTSEDISDYSDWLSSESDDVGAHTGSHNRRAGRMGGMVRQKVGPATGTYDPELAATLGLEGK